MKNIAIALVKAQMEMGNAKKDNNNPFFKSKYADLNSIREAVIPPLNNNGISVLQPIVHIEGKNFVKTMLLHDSGEVLEGFTEIVYSKVNDAQAQGSGITYARRYGLQSMVCVGADDDDGNAASKPQPVKASVPIDEVIKRVSKISTEAELNAYYTELGYSKENPAPAATIKIFADQKALL